MIGTSSREIDVSYIHEPEVRVGSGSLRYFHRNQQYSITALTNASGTITERYSYTAYGQPTFFDGSGTVISSSAENNRMMYMGREWDSELVLYHYRARMYDAVAGRFCSRDPIGYEGSPFNLFEYCGGVPTCAIDPTGMHWWWPPGMPPPPPWVAGLACGVVCANVMANEAAIEFDCLGRGYVACVKAERNALGNEFKLALHGCSTVTAGGIPVAPGGVPVWP